jgi:hypothetical protein
MTIANEHQNDNLTLHLPRILCLHGGGTNARIFRMQCRIIERDLRPYFRLVYAEAPFAAKPGPDVTSVYREYGPFKSWLRMDAGDALQPPEKVLHAVNTAVDAAKLGDDLLGATGEWVAILGFSQGAKIAASMLYLQQTAQGPFVEYSKTPTEFQFAILLAGRGPLVWMESGGITPLGFADASQVSTADTVSVTSKVWQQPLLSIPTIHIHGLQDPGLDLHRRLLDYYCDPETSILLEWNGNHRIPIKSLDVNAVVNAILSMAWETNII